MGCKFFVGVFWYFGCRSCMEFGGFRRRLEDVKKSFTQAQLGLCQTVCG